MSGYLGADPDRLDALGQSLLAQAGSIDELRAGLGGQLYGTDWTGADAEETRADWETSHAPALGAAVDLLRAMSQALLHHAVQQRGASAADGASSGGVPAQRIPVSQIPHTGADPAAVRDWWAGLTQRQREDLMHHQPQRIGALDGIPAADRDTANRVLLEQLLRKDPHNPGLDALHDRLAGKHDPRAYLLGLAANGDGRAIVAINNPDESANVITYVPGTGADLSKIDGDLVRADRMAADANQLDPTRQTSAVLWLGYDAPDSIVPDAMNPGYAENAAGGLSRFQDGLRITHEGEPSHNSIIGHSYGSTTVGIAGRDQGLAVDDMIFVGSPGVGVDNAGDLGISSDHVWSTTAANDPIQYAVVPHPLAPIPSVIVNEARGELIHGLNPSRDEFGAHVFTSDPGTPLITTKHVSVQVPLLPVPPNPVWSGPTVEVGTDVPVGVDPHAHSEYWDSRNESRSNIARIATGNYDEVR
ncbi:hypothetical protein F4553_000356 [Allocatelliglobosispora scoriae]|uniref:DUF1023 domain-containing protein n=1 Tax=Allocatelliglobosispora scoriae TaxID=643052 RepID=A0A841BCZ4_9ACTN|nr:alpha/beta hydrolase [Allocatelliglobosispora scoriae]MBB5866977.1 hypothetical protein [Allocatelliglobosispora scoriae]